MDPLATALGAELPIERAELAGAQPMAAGQVVALERERRAMLGLARRVDAGPTGRWRKFSRAQIAERGDNLDLAWLKDDSADTAQQQLEEPAILARLAMREMQAAMDGYDEPALKPVFEQLEGRISYGKLRLYRAMVSRLASS